MIVNYENDFYTPGELAPICVMNVNGDVNGTYTWVLEAKTGLPILKRGACEHKNGVVTSYYWAEDGSFAQAADICVDCGNSSLEAEDSYDVREVIDREADCTHNGAKHYVAVFEKHGTVESASVPIVAKGHSFKLVRSTYASCTTAGTFSYVCEHCGATETTHPAAYGHSWGAYTVTRQATCTDSGVKTHTCRACGATETVTTPPLGHKINAETGVCERCSELITEPQTDPAKTFVPTTTVTEADGTQTVTENPPAEEGGLHGGAALKPTDFADIVAAQKGDTEALGSVLSEGNVWIVAAIGGAAVAAAAALIFAKKKKKTASDK